MLNRSRLLIRPPPAARLAAWLARFFVLALLIMTAVDGTTMAYEPGQEPVDTGELPMMLRLTFWTLLPVVLITIASLLWSWLLRRQVAHRTRQLQRELGERQQAETVTADSST